MAHIAIIGAGYVGLTTASCLADLGNQAICIDIDAARIATLRAGRLPIFEPGLAELIARTREAGRLEFTTDYETAIPGADFAFIAVGTPSGAAGEADTAFSAAAARAIARAMPGPLTIVNKSTMPIGAGDFITTIVQREQRHPCPFSVVANPEFLREGSAVHDFMHPDRIVLGANDRSAAEVVADLYRPLGAPVLITDMRTAEMIKYASNAFLATKISFVNEIATICEQLGADVTDVARGMGYDPRIGAQFLSAGLGYGGSCFPKDVRALEYMASVHGCHPQLLRAVMEINRDVRRSAILKLRAALGVLEGRTIGVLGLSFKPNTDDLRDAPALEIIHLLQNEGATIRAYDPAAMDAARPLLPDVTVAADPYELAEECDAIVLVTEWPEFIEMDLERVRDRMAGRVLLDGRNVYDPARMARLGFTYLGMGRGAVDDTRQSTGMRGQAAMAGRTAAQDRALAARDGATGGPRTSAIEDRGSVEGPPASAPRPGRVASPT